jgi:hypothetical protein
VQRDALLGAKLVVDHAHFYLGAIGHVGGLAQHEPTALHLYSETLHARDRILRAGCEWL